MSRMSYRFLPLVVCAVVIAAGTLAPPANAREQRMDSAEREQLRSELRERYRDQRGRYDRRGQRDEQALPPEAAPERDYAGQRQRLSREEMRVLRQQLREQRRDDGASPGESRGVDRGERRDRRNRNGRGNRGERDSQGDSSGGWWRWR